jgi:hypothetical protein
VGAVFNCALQLGGALGVACVTSIQTSVDRKHPTKLNGFAGRATAFWFLLGCVGLLLLATVLFYKIVRPKGDVETGKVVEQPEKEIQLEEESNSPTEEKESKKPIPQTA